MIQDVMLKMIMEDLAAIKDKMDALIRTEETVRIQQKQIVAIFKKIDVQEKRIASTEAAITGNATSANDIKSAVKWLSALASAFLIAMYLNNTKPVNAAALPNKDLIVKTMQVEKKEN